MQKEMSELCKEAVNRLFFSKDRAVKYSDIPQLFEDSSLFEEVTTYLGRVGIRLAKDHSQKVIAVLPDPEHIAMTSLGKEASALLVYLIVKTEFLKSSIKRKQLDAELKGRMRPNRITMALNELKSYFLIKQEGDDIYPEWALDTNVNIENIKQRCSKTIIETTIERFDKEESVD